MDAILMKDLICTLMLGRQTITTTLNDKDLSLAEFTALAQIEHNREHSPENIYADDLQQYLFVSKPAISQMLKALEKAGYIKREINLENRRKLTVTLTDEGRQALKIAKRYYRDALERIVETFGVEKTRQLISLFSEFSSIATDVRKTMS